MSTTDPTSRKFTFDSITNIVPFTARAGDTYLTILEKMADYLSKLAENVNTSLGESAAAVTAAIEQAKRDVEEMLAIYMGEVDNKLDGVDSEIEALIAAVNDAVNQLINNSVELQDSVMAGIFTNPSSESRRTTDALYANSPEVFHRGYVFNGVWVDEWTITTKGRHINGLLSRQMGGGPLPVDSTDFKTPKQYSIEHGGGLVVNGSAWHSGMNGIRGANIYEGVAYGELSDRHNQDNACIAYCEDGKLRYYEHALGQTAEDAINDGAIYSWSFGPAIILDGAPFNYLNTGGWGTLNRTQLSGRALLAQTNSGDIKVFQVYGASNVSGMTIDECSALLAGKDIRIASFLDAGGSVQSALDGDIVHPSSDSAGSRMIPDTISFAAPAGNQVRYPTTSLPLADPTLSGNLTIRCTGNEAVIDGAIIGEFTTQPNTLIVDSSNIPPWFRNGRHIDLVTMSAGRMGAIRSRGGALYIMTEVGGGPYSNADIHTRARVNFGLN